MTNAVANLTGTTKQVSWASEIRDRNISELTKALEAAKEMAKAADTEEFDLQQFVTVDGSKLSACAFSHLSRKVDNQGVIKLLTLCLDWAKGDTKYSKAGNPTLAKTWIDEGDFSPAQTLRHFARTFVTK